MYTLILSALEQSIFCWKLNAEVFLEKNLNVISCEMVQHYANRMSLEYE